MGAVAPKTNKMTPRLNHGCTNFAKMCQPPQHSGSLKGDMRKDSHAEGTQMLGAIIQNSVDWGFLDSWIKL